MATFEEVNGDNGAIVLPITPTGGTVSFMLSGGGGTRTLTLPITPEEIVIHRPSRQAVTQTLTSAYQDHLGSGVATVIVRGHTGWRDRGAGTGYQVITRLRDDILDAYDKAVSQGDPTKVKLDLLCALPGTWEHFRVSKNSASFSRSRAQPLLYRYEIQFTVLHDYNETSPNDPSPNFVISFANIPRVVITGTGYVNVPRPPTTPPKKEKEEEEEVVVTGPSGPTTVGALADIQYSSSVYPPGMWAYVISWNRHLFGNPPFSAQTALSVNYEKYHIPFVSPGIADPESVIRELNGGYTAQPSDISATIDPGTVDTGAAIALQQVSFVWFDVGGIDS